MDYLPKLVLATLVILLVRIGVEESLAPPFVQRDAGRDAWTLLSKFRRIMSYRFQEAFEARRMVLVGRRLGRTSPWHIPPPQSNNPTHWSYLTVAPTPAPSRAPAPPIPAPPTTPPPSLSSPPLQIPPPSQSSVPAPTPPPSPSYVPPPTPAPSPYPVRYQSGLVSKAIRS